MSTVSAKDDMQRRDERALWQSRLKSTDTLANRALQREKEGDFNASYNLCLQAARAYLWLIRNSPDETTTKTLKAISARLLSRAEKIKLNKKGVYATPVSKLDEFEQSAVLENASVIRGRVFRPWTPQLPLELLDGQLFSDPGGHFSLSQEQQDRLASFKRISELSDSPVILSTKADPKHIYQSCVTDCTVISSLISCLQHSKRFASSLSKSLLYPRDSAGSPQYNPNGKYVARLAVNGTWRAIEIDDYLPMAQDGSLLCAHMLPGNDYWAALLEKAFVKLHGGYRIPGSDAAADLYTFTGWIPETICLRRPSFRSEQTWDRLFKAFNAGCCLISLGSGSKSISLGDDRELASKHAFAVLAIEDHPQTGRIIELVDPWYDVGSNEIEDRLSIRLSWTTVCESFQSLYCNWDPEAFDTSEALHLKCTNDEPLNLAMQLGPSPSIEKDEIWMLLSKHSDTRVEEEYISLQIREDISSTSPSKLPIDLATDYTNSPHILVKFQPERPQAVLSILIAKVGPQKEITFTLTAYSPCPVYFTDTSLTLPYTQSIKGMWDERSSGGNPMHSTYIHNPHYAFTADALRPVQLQATCQAAESIPINLKLIRRIGSPDSRIQQFETCSLVADSGAYRYRTTSLSVQALPQGHYILIPSTFEPGQRANFVIRLKTSVPVSEPNLVPAEDSGKFVRTMKGTLPAPTSNRMLHQEKYLDNPRFLLRPRQGCSVSVRLRQSSKGSTPLNASIFSDVSQQASSLHAVGSTGGYASYIAGVTLGPIKLRSTPQGYVLVVSGATVSGAVNTGDIDFDLVILSDHPVDVTRMPG